MSVTVESDVLGLTVFRDERTGGQDRNVMPTPLIVAPRFREWRQYQLRERKNCSPALLNLGMQRLIII